MGSVRGTRVMIVFVFHFFLTRLNKEFAVSGLGMVFKFQRSTGFGFCVLLAFG